MAETKIEWTDFSWNPVTGCEPVSAGCQHCYAARMAKRLAGRNGYPADDPFRVIVHADRLNEPCHWKKPRRIFVCSMGDLFHEDVTAQVLERVFATMAFCLQHTFIVLTKRPERLAKALQMVDAVGHRRDHVWLGVSVENQVTADERIPWLLKCPAAVRFLSLEPLLGPVDLSVCPNCKGMKTVNESGKPDGSLEKICGMCLGRGRWEFARGIHWVIVGGESGPGARPMHPDWVRTIRDQCQQAGVPWFFKQWGDAKPDVMEVRAWERAGCDFREKKGGRLLDGREWNEFPEVK